MIRYVNRGEGAGDQSREGDGGDDLFFHA